MATTEFATFSICRACKGKCAASHRSFPANSRGLSFFKVMVVDYFSSLEIPSDIANHIQYRAYGVASLEGPSGYIWHVNICRRNSSLYFKDGWKRFTSDHSVGSEDILVFKHVLNLYFLVQIFEPTGYEKPSSFTLCSHKTSNSGERNLPKEQIKLEDVKEEAKVQCLTVYKHDLAIYEADISSLYEVQKRASRGGTYVRETVSLLPPSIRKFLHAFVDTGSEKMEFQTVASKGAVSGRFRLINSTCSPFHGFSASEFLSVNSIPNMFGKFIKCLPKKVALHWFPNKCTDVFLSDHVNIGKLYATQFVNYRRHHGFCGNWKNIVLANKLEERDTCVFKLVSKEFYVFKLHIVKSRDKDEKIQNDKSTPKVNTWEICDKKCERKLISQRHAKAYQPKQAASMFQGYVGCSKALDQSNFEEKVSIKEGRKKDIERVKGLPEDTKIDLFIPLREQKQNAEFWRIK